MARKNVRKTTFDSTFEMIRLKPIRKQEKQLKAFEGTSVEPTRFGTYGTQNVSTTNANNILKQLFLSFHVQSKKKKH